MNLRSLLSIPLTISTILTNRLSSIVSVPNSLYSAVGVRTATTMVLDPTKLNVLHAPLQPHTKEGDWTHPTGFQRDGYCWGNEQDPGNHFIGGVVTKEFLEYSKAQGNDLITRQPGFPGLKDGCRWCLCVNRWKEAVMASEKLGERVVPRVDLSSTALNALKKVSIEDLKKYEYKP
ncbi:hypothetical protein L486_06634 [Kwoniella mangroviensis CBS 10435]|uniref:DUF2237 domain-containing protein n=1 Tax=Kwoniella mangroviensis CBS 10435 TaxID=1331196 RepID=A0A1B9IJM4_9TREE|nr:uncharacterized protein I203_05333 [Kwoniella mangroviensis CBS 8507]OCF55878.1 hypothetical protein L486_06634 [Kwoniella mangroviensis CBS 10435]OCF65653.1 hypothetical protein I203_05333 [Kwoniella mangroviensis CBS 8507]